MFGVVSCQNLIFFVNFLYILFAIALLFLLRNGKKTALCFCFACLHFSLHWVVFYKNIHCVGYNVGFRSLMVWLCRSNFALRKLELIMKKVLLAIFALCVAFAARAQEFPYSKYLNYTKEQFKDSRFKYHKKTNTWVLNKISALNTTLNVLAIIADADEELRPDVNDYCIVAQLGEADTVAWVEVYFYNDNTYHKLLTFLKDNGEKLVETSSGKLVKHQAFYGDYALELDMEQHIISRTSARTADPKTVKNVDESYNEYQFTIRSSVKPWSEYLEKQAAKQAKRDAKGKKKQSIDDLM